MVGSGAYNNVYDAVNNIVKIKSTVKPDSQTVALYDKKYEIFKSLYPALKNAFAKM